MATTFRTPETTATEARQSTNAADSLVGERAAEHPVAPRVERHVERLDGPIEATRPTAPARYPGRRLDRLFRTEPAAPSPRDFVLAQVDPTFAVRSIQR